MITIDFSNVQKLIFLDQTIQEKLPEFQNLFQQWKLGQFVPSLRPMAQKALLDLLNQLNQNHISMLKEHFGDEIKIKKLDYTMIKNYTVLIDEAQNQIDKLSISGELFIHRNASQLYIGIWK